MKNTVKTGVRFLLNTAVFLLMFVYIYYSANGSQNDANQIYNHVLGVIVIGNLLGFMVLFLNRMIGKIFRKSKRTGLKFFTTLIVDLSLGLFLLLYFIRIYVSVFTDIPVETFLDGKNESIVRVIILSFSVLIIYLIIDFLLYSYNEFSRIQIEGVSGKRKQLQLQFEALKTQLSPHYLFNSLNTISALLYKSPVDTELFIRNLSKTYQYIIATHRESLVALEKELQFVQDYLHLLKVRFGDAINLTINIPDENRKLALPPMSLQILMENAVKHNTFSDEEQLFVEITLKNNDTIIVKNNILKQPKQVSSFKIGLNNIKSQYRFLTNRSVQLKKDQFFTVELPLLKQKGKQS